MRKRSLAAVAGIALGYFIFAVAAGIAAWKAAGIATLALLAGAMYSKLADDYRDGLARRAGGGSSNGARAMVALVQVAGALCVLFLVLLLSAWALGEG